MKILCRIEPTPRRGGAKIDTSTNGVFLCTNCGSVVQYGNLDLWFSDSDPARVCDCPECGYSTIVPILGGGARDRWLSFKIEPVKGHHNRKQIQRWRIGKLGH